MGLHKGQTNNPNGRPKGSKSKTGEELRELILAFIEKNLPDVQENYDKLEPKEKLSFLEKLFSFALPKMQAVKMEIDNINTPPLQIIVSDTETKEFLEEVKAELNAIDEEIK